MPRPTLLVAEPEPLQALSVRKLVLETAKFNVLTAHSTEEALEIFRMFPNISGAVMVIGGEMPCEEVAKSIKQTTHKVPVIALEQRIGGNCEYADHHVSSHDPQALLDLIRQLFGDPRSIDGGPDNAP